MGAGPLLRNVALSLKWSSAVLTGSDSRSPFFVGPLTSCLDIFLALTLSKAAKWLPPFEPFHRLWWMDSACYSTFLTIDRITPGSRLSAWNRPYIYSLRKQTFEGVCHRPIVHKGLEIFKMLMWFPMEKKASLFKVEMMGVVGRFSVCGSHEWEPFIKGGIKEYFQFLLCAPP